MKTAIRILIVVLSSLVLPHCAPTRFVKTLQKKQQAASFSFGGPLIKFAGAVIPIPLSTVGYACGVSDKVTAYGDLHTTSLLFGNLQSDFGATFRIYEKENKFGFSASPALQFAYNLRHATGFRVWPSADLNGYLHLRGKPSYAYAGANAWFELATKRAHGEAQSTHVLPNLHVGYTIVKTQWQHQFQLSYLGLGAAVYPGVVDYVGVYGKGSFGFYYALVRKF